MSVALAVALFGSALLIFWVELLAGKMLTPLLGGAPQVWVTCMLFFQVVLLAGYAYADQLARRVTMGRQIVVQLTLLACGAAVLPLTLPEFVRGPLRTTEPTVLVLAGLVAMVGLPFLALSAHAPLLQRWFAASGRRRSRDPYFLYVASNAGSFVALLAFPLLLEPGFGVSTQGWLWSGSYVAVALGVAVLALGMRGAAFAAKAVEAPAVPLARGRMLGWLGLAALPSSHLLATTVVLSQDLAAVPLLWVAPLALYLLSFVIAFSRWQSRASQLSARTLPIVLVALVFLLVTGATEPGWLIALAHLLTLFVGALLCHGRLAAQRPPVAQLTRFYLALSAGGALGGAFNALLAPLLFNDTHELPLALLALALVLPAHRQWERRALLGPLVAGTAALGFALLGDTAALTDLGWGRLLLGLPLVVAFTVAAWPKAFALALGAVLLVHGGVESGGGKLVARERSFFGVHRVVDAGDERRLFHGSTRHGSQPLETPRRLEPGTYYHPEGPAGEVLQRLARDGSIRRLGMVGLGTGALAAYATPQQQLTFYEIDPVVRRLALEHFSFLSESRAASVTIEIGDGRHLLEQADDDSLDLLVLDAFSSGAVPVHLLTVEAFRVYRRVLGADGLLLMHVSNRHLDLQQLVAEAAAVVGLAGLACVDLPGADAAARRSPSEWVLLSTRSEPLASLALGARWHPLVAAGRLAPFEDGFSDLLRALVF